MKARLAAVCVVAVLAAGCAQPGPPAGVAQCPEAVARVHAIEAWGGGHAPGEPQDFLYAAVSPVPATVSVRVTDGSGAVFGDGEPVPFEHVVLASGNGTQLGTVRTVPQTPEQVVASVAVADARPGCSALTGGFVSTALVREMDGPAASAGQGAHVWYAGFWENGTLFDTNLEELDLSDWPRAGWYQGGHWDPIPVYVYDQDRSEQPQEWRNPFAGTPASGSVLDDQAGAGYFTTIKGFNEAVKGLPAGTRQAFRLAPEDAYTLPGREQHPLYGDALVFLVEVRDVVDRPCPSPRLAPGACDALGDAPLRA